MGSNLAGGNDAVALLARQERIVQEELPDGGRIVKELGDGLLIWFDHPRDALQTCLGLQRRFEAEPDDPMPLWVRMGLHWGCPRRRGDDIVGRDVNLAARIVDLAAPGEVLCSQDAVHAIGVVAGVEFVPLGPVIVRGFSEPVPLVRAIAV